MSVCMMAANTYTMAHDMPSKDECQITAHLEIMAQIARKVKP